MANEFIIKNGYVSQGDSSVAGSLSVSGDVTITGSLSVSGSIQSQDVLYTHNISGSYTEGQKFIWQSPHGDYRTYIVRTGQTLAAGETPFTNAEKLIRIDGRRLIKSDNAIASGIANSAIITFDINKTNKKIMLGTVGTTSLRIIQEDASGSLSVLATLTASGNLNDILYISSINEYWVLISSTIDRYDASTNTSIGSISLSGVITPTAAYQLVLDATRGYVYVIYFQTTTRLLRVDIATLAIDSNIVNPNSNAGRGGMLNESTGYLYMSSTGTGTRIVDVAAWANLSTYTFNITGIVGALGYPFLLPGNRIVYLSTNIEPQVFDLTDPQIPSLITKIRNGVRSIYGTYVEKTNSFYIVNRSVLNNNFQNRVSAWDATTYDFIDESSVFVEQNGSIPFTTNESQGKIIYDSLNNCVWVGFSQNLAGVNGILKINI
jgi:hypothetical protein